MRISSTVIACATALSLACPSSAPNAPRAGGDAATNAEPEAAIRVRVAQAEAKRGAGVDSLIDVAKHDRGLARLLALRGLGRVGGAKARAVLHDALAATDPDVVAYAAEALGVAAALADEDAKASAELTPALIAALRATPAEGADRAAVIEAIGRAGDPALAAPALIDALHAGGDTAIAAALAFGRFGRRKLAWHDGHADVVAATRAPAAALRYAATYALARQQDAHDDSDGEAALAARVSDDDAEVRATAVAGLDRRDQVGANRATITAALWDKDWRVSIEAMRALGGAHSDTAGRVAAAQALVDHARRMDGEPREGQIVIEGLRAITAKPMPVDALHAFSQIATIAGAVKRDPLARAWVLCLVEAALARETGDVTRLAACGGDAMPEHLRLGLVADLVEHGATPLAARRTALAPLLAHADPRVRGAGLGALASLYKDSAGADREAITSTVISALADRDLVVRASALDAAETLLAAIGDAHDGALDQAIVARAVAEPEVEVAADALGLVGTHHLANGGAACTAALHKHPVIAAAGAACLTKLGEGGAPPAGEPLAARPPPLDVTAVIGARVTWHVETTRGELVFELRPDVAPWGVAAIASLTTKGSYDDLEFHRVVPDFVAQGGDPTNSGMGGPDFLLPAEPGDALDGPGFATGGVGLADSGPDSAGSQWFVMHARAPHLDSRYTWVGTLTSGQNVADSLLIGDKVLHAKVEIVPPKPNPH